MDRQLKSNYGSYSKKKSLILSNALHYLVVLFTHTFLVHLNIAGQTGLVYQRESGAIFKRVL